MDYPRRYTGYNIIEQKCYNLEPSKRKWIQKITNSEVTTRIHFYSI